MPVARGRCCGTFGGSMTKLRPFLRRLHHRVGWFGVSLLMLPILGWVWLAAREPAISVFNGGVPYYVLSGKLFSEPFNIVHAGFVMDQPTIGKWLFWFSFMALSSLPYVTVVRWLADRKTPAGRFAYGIWVAVFCVLLWCMLSWPLCWLIQYVCSMGITPRRILGLVYAVAGGLLLIGFVLWGFRNPNRNDAGAQPNGGPALQPGNSGVMDGPPSVQLMRYNPRNFLWEIVRDFVATR